MAKHTNNIEEPIINFNDVKDPNVILGTKIGYKKYKKDENGNIISNEPIINAIDIDWNAANVDGKTIKTTADLLRYISTKSPNIESFDVNKLDWGNKTIYDQSIDSTEQLLQLIEQHQGQGSGQGEEVFPDIPSDKVIGIMLSAIRALQGEVTKLRNSFIFGINSYAEDNFHMSQTVEELNNIEEEEPLWATDENELSFITGIDLSSAQIDSLSPIENYEIIQNDKIGYTNKLTFNISNTNNDLLKDINDPKIYVYLTCTSKNVNFVFRNKNGEYYNINLNKIIPQQYYPSKYNILCILSREITLDNNTKGGKNFVWFSIAEYGKSGELFNGYIDINNININLDINNINYITSETPIYSDNTLIFDSIEFNYSNSKQYIYKLDLYSKYQDVNEIVLPATPTNLENFKYSAAHLTIRSISTYDKLLLHKKQLQQNELIFCESNKNLYIYTNGNIINIGNGNQNNQDQEHDIMENYEIIKALAAQGLITINFKDTSYTSDVELYDTTNIQSYVLNKIITVNDIEEINFINGDTGKKFNIKINPYGEFDIKEILNNTSLYEQYGDQINNLPNDYGSDRSFVSLIKSAKKGLDITKDLGLNADRIQIGSIYAPKDTDKMFGCTHGFIELFNSSDEDFYLDGCYLHYSRTNTAAGATSENVKYYKLPLKGYIPKGGTYLIRCKQYADGNDINTFINVNTYDIEWYENNQLLDLSLHAGGSYQFLLTYGDESSNGVINQNTRVARLITNDNSSEVVKNSKKGTYALIKGFIDSLMIGDEWGDNIHWVPNSACKFNISSNTIYKITFELDPAKQAFNSLTISDSSRQRWQNAGTDYQYVNLDRKYIEFPKTDIRKNVSDYTPKASYENKNVITDKTQLNINEPNTIVCSYGKNPYTTRCFNWISHGSFDEAIVIIDPETNKEYIFESYKNKTYTSGDENIYIDNYNDNNFPKRHEFNSYINNIVYGSGNLNDEAGKRLYGKFPGNNLTYTSHKCIIDFCNDYEYNENDEAKTYKYYVCRLNKFGKLDKTYKSDIKEFTLYRKNYTPKLYQITDQQGFHWIEYQVWAAAAKALNEKITQDIENSEEKIMPIIINTGDMVQSGARLNEWIDYFEAGKYLFDHFAQNNIVGNNDLCDTNPEILGTGDDIGKSNGYFFNLFNCYQVDDNDNSKYLPIANNKYIPSLYFIDININKSNKTRILFINSEITVTNCKDWFNLKKDNNVINIYTGYTINSNQEYAATDFGFTPIYDILYHWTNNSSIGYLPVCHEMPFTVITNKCLSWTNKTTQYNRYRSQSDAATPKLIGSHCNQISDNEEGKGLYWMSRLFESRGITLCLGGHKHTYACTYPVRENYLYVDPNTDSIKWSYKDGPMVMPETLENDTIQWKIYEGIKQEDDTYSIGKEINLSKFPIVKRQESHKRLDSFNVKVNITYTDNNEIKHNVIQTTLSKESKDNLIKENDEYVIVAIKKIENANNVTYDYANSNDTIFGYIYKLNEGLTITPVIDDKGELVYETKDIPGGTSINIIPFMKKNNGEYVKIFDNDDSTFKIQLTTMDPQRFYPFIDKLENDTNKFVTYLMCQATGYKLTSNKELPSEFQKFSMVIPKSYIDGGNDKPSSDQQMPMFTIIDFTGINKYKIQLGRINNISGKATKMEFTQSSYSTKKEKIEYLILSKKSINGIWCYYDSNKELFEQTDTYQGGKTQLEYRGNEKKYFSINDNADNILYTNLIDSKSQYLFDTSL